MATRSSSSSTRSNLGPLITTFTPPDSCSVLGVDESTQAVAWQAQQCFTAITLGGTVLSSINVNGVADDFTCWPSTESGVPQPTPPLWGWGFYSPGIICPVGYAKACTSAVLPNGSPSSITSGTYFPFQFGLQAHETAIGCCPAGYSCASNPQTCMSTMTTGVAEVTQCVSNTSTTTYSLTVPMTGQSTVIPTLSLFAPLIQLVYQSTDTTASAFTPATNTASPTTTPVSSASTSVARPIANDLTGGDKAGIGVAVGSAVLIAALVSLTWWFRKKRKASRARPTPSNGPPPAGKQMMSNDDVDYQIVNQRGEMPAERDPQELPGDSGHLRHKSTSPGDAGTVYEM